MILIFKHNFLFCIIFIASFTNAKNVIEQELEIKVGSGILCGVYSHTSLPVKKLVIIVAGSGPTDRDGNSIFYECNNLKNLSDSLLKIQGIATFRFDKRGVGKSIFKNLKEDDIRIDTFVKDIVRWTGVLNKITPSAKIYLIGHSEGSLIGMLAAQIIKPHGFISLSGPGNSADKILKKQLQLLPTILKDVAFCTIDSISNGYTVTNVEISLAALFRPSVQPYLRSWFKYVPSKEIAKLDCQVLIIFGGLDLQVDTIEAKCLTKYIFKYKKAYISDMNHFLQKISHIETGMPVSTLHTKLIAEISKFLQTLP